MQENNNDDGDDDDELLLSPDIRAHPMIALEVQVPGSVIHTDNDRVRRTSVAIIHDSFPPETEYVKKYVRLLNFPSLLIILSADRDYENEHLP